jgi:hypothetical protein
MINDTWDARAIPILQFLAARDDMDPVSIGQIVDATGIQGRDVVSEIDRLTSGGYINSRLVRLGTGGDVRPWFLDGSRLGERGARTVGMWPSEDGFQALLQLIERRIDGESDQARKVGLSRLKDSLIGIGAATGTTLLSAWLQGIVGLH